MKDWNVAFFGAEAPPKTWDEVLPGAIPNRKESINHNYLIGYVVVQHHCQPAGRLCLYQNPAIDGGKTLLFGNLYCIEEEKTFRLLMQEVFNFATQNGFTKMTGPLNGSTWDEYRLPLNRFGSQFITDLPQPAYYTEFLLRYGFTISHRYATYLSPIQPKTSNPKLVQQVQQSGIHIRPINLGYYEAELEKLYPFCNAVFANNILYSPITKESFLEKYLQVKPLLQASFVQLAEDAAGTLQAFILCLPDTHQKDRLVMKTIARNTRNRQSAGLVQYLADGIYNEAYAAGYRHLLHAFMHNSNQSKVLSQKNSGHLFKEYALFSKKIEA